MSLYQERGSQSSSTGKTRRTVIAGATLLGITAWFVQRSCQESLQQDDETKVRNEVRRLAQKLEDGSLVKRLYLDPHYMKELSPLFTPLRVVAASRTKDFYSAILMVTPLSPDEQYILHTPDSAPMPRKRYQSIEVSIAFSPSWLETTSDEVKTLAMKKEAIHLLLWPSMKLIAEEEFKRKRWTIQITKPGLSPEIALQSAIYDYLFTDEDAFKLYEYAGYLGILWRLEQLLQTETGDHAAEIRKRMGLLDLPEEARKRQIPLEALQFENTPTEQFLRYAFTEGSPWVNLVLNPKYPSPSINTRLR